MNLVEVEELLVILILKGMRWVGFEIENKISNDGENIWDEELGMFFVWILSMFNFFFKIMVIVFFRFGEEMVFGKIVIDDYFGKVFVNRLKIMENVFFF